MNVEINKNNYELMKSKIEKYENSIYSDVRFDRVFNKLSESLKEGLIGVYCYDKEIKDIEIVDYLYFDIKTSAKQRLDKFLEKEPLVIPLSIKVTTIDNLDYGFQLIDKEGLRKKLNGLYKDDCINKINLIKKESYDIAKKGMYQLIKNSEPRRFYAFGLADILNFISYKLGKTNIIEYKEELEELLLTYNKNPTLENYKTAKKIMAKFAKIHFFNNLKNKKANKYLNKKVFYNNSAFDYIIYNHLRGLKANNGLELLKEKTLYELKMSGEHKLSRINYNGVNLIYLINKINNSEIFIMKLRSEINNEGIHLRKKSFDII